MRFFPFVFALALAPSVAAAGDSVVIRSERTGNYITVDGDSHWVANAPADGATWFTLNGDSSSMSIRAASGLYLYDPANGSPATVTSAEAGAGEQFALVSDGQGRFFLQSVRTGLYAYDRWGAPIPFTSTEAEAGEVFELLRNSNDPARTRRCEWLDSLLGNRCRRLAYYSNTYCTRDDSGRTSQECTDASTAVHDACIVTKRATTAACPLEMYSSPG